MGMILYRKKKKKRSGVAGGNTATRNFGPGDITASEGPNEKVLRHCELRSVEERGWRMEGPTGGRVPKTLKNYKVEGKIYLL